MVAVSRAPARGDHKTGTKHDLASVISTKSIFNDIVVHDVSRPEDDLKNICISFIVWEGHVGDHIRRAPCEKSCFAGQSHRSSSWGGLRYESRFVPRSRARGDPTVFPCTGTPVETRITLNQAKGRVYCAHFSTFAGIGPTSKKLNTYNFKVGATTHALCLLLARTSTRHSGLLRVAPKYQTR